MSSIVLLLNTEHERLIQCFNTDFNQHFIWLREKLEQAEAPCASEPATEPQRENATEQDSKEMNVEPACENDRIHAESLTVAATASTNEMQTDTDGEAQIPYTPIPVMKEQHAETAVIVDIVEQPARAESETSSIKHALSDEPIGTTAQQQDEFSEARRQELLEEVQTSHMHCSQEQQKKKRDEKRNQLDSMWMSMRIREEQRKLEMIEKEKQKRLAEEALARKQEKEKIQEVLCST